MKKEEGVDSFGSQLLYWVKKTTGMLTAVSAFFTLVAWALSNIYSEEINHFWDVIDHVEDERSNYRPHLESRIKTLEEEIEILHARWEEKDKSFAIGLRVDKNTGKITYRHKDGEDYRIQIYEDLGTVYFTNLEGYLQPIYKFKRN